MKNIRKNIAILAITVAFVLSSCGNSDSMTESEIQSDTQTTGNEETVTMTATEAPQTVVEFPAKYTNTINGVTFDAEVQVPDADLNALVKCTASVQHPDTENARQTFTSGKSAVEEVEDTGKGEDGEEFVSFYGTYEDGSQLITDTGLMYATSFFQSVYSAFRMGESYDSNADLYSKDGSFDFMTAEQAFADVKQKINASGYSLEDLDYTYYALDAETMAEQELQLDQTGDIIEGAGRDWTDEDNCYYFFGEQICEGIPVYYGDEDFPEDYEENRPIQAVYSTRGLERLDVTKAYSFFAGDEKVELADFDTAAQSVAKKYGDILTGAAYNVTRAKLYQMPVKQKSGDYQMIVTWLFEVHETGIDSETGENFENVLYTFVNAETGEEVSL